MLSVKYCLHWWGLHRGGAAYQPARGRLHALGEQTRSHLLPSSHEVGSSVDGRAGSDGIVASLIPLLQPARLAPVGVLASMVVMALRVTEAPGEAKEPLAARTEVGETGLKLAMPLAVWMVAMLSMAVPEQVETMLTMAWTAAWRRWHRWCRW